MKYALIGCGRISPNHLRAAIYNGLEIVALCDLSQEKMEQAAKEHQLPSAVRFYTDYRKMLSEAKPELVSVATDSGVHAEIALACMDSGAHVLVEKPMAMSLADADEMIRRARERGVTLGVCHQNRFNRAVQKMREAVESGQFGRLYHGTIQVRWHRQKDYYDQGAWRGTWDQDGGCLMNQCIHGIDLLRWMLGDEVIEVTAYTAQLAHPYIQAEDLGLALVRFKSGAYGMIEGTVNCFEDDFEETLALFGERGMARVGGVATNIMDIWRFAGENEEEVKKAYSEQGDNIYGGGHALVFRDVLAAIREGREPYIDGAAGRRALELVLAIYASSKLGHAVSLPLESGSTTEFSRTF